MALEMAHAVFGVEVDEETRKLNMEPLSGSKITMQSLSSMVCVCVCILEATATELISLKNKFVRWVWV